jgi:hypothetical protein
VIVASGLMHLLARLVPKDMASNMPFLEGTGFNAHAAAFASAIALVAARLGGYKRRQIELLPDRIAVGGAAAAYATGTTRLIRSLLDRELHGRAMGQRSRDSRKRNRVSAVFRVPGEQNSGEGVCRSADVDHLRNICAFRSHRTTGAAQRHIRVEA